MFGGGGGGSSPPVTKPVDKVEEARITSEKEGEQRTLARKRKGIASTRLTDPVAAQTTQSNASKRRVSLLGGGTPETQSAG